MASQKGKHYTGSIQTSLHAPLIVKSSRNADAKIPKENRKHTHTFSLNQRIAVAITLNFISTHRDTLPLVQAKACLRFHRRGRRLERSPSSRFFFILE